MVRLIVIVALLILGATATTSAQSREIKPLLTNRVDTTDTNVRAVIQLFTDYINNRPDSTFDNPYWSDRDKSAHPDYYWADVWLYQPKVLLDIYDPHILSVERQGDYQVLRVLYYREGLEGVQAGSNPWALQALYAARENGEWRFFDPLYIRTADWPREYYPPVLYIHDPSHEFDTLEAARQKQQIDSIATAFDLVIPDTIEYYLTDHVDNLMWALGLDWVLAPATGRTSQENNQILCALGTEYYGHEMVHVLFGDVDLPFILSEGLATWLGGSSNEPFDIHAAALAEFLETDTSITLQQLLDQPYQGGTTVHAYATGAILFDQANRRGGITTVRRLLNCKPDNKALQDTLAAVFEVPRDRLTVFWREIADSYSADQ